MQVGNTVVAAGSTVAQAEHIEMQADYIAIENKVNQAPDRKTSAATAACKLATAADRMDFEQTEIRPYRPVLQELEESQDYKIRPVGHLGLWGWATQS